MAALNVELAKKPPGCLEHIVVHGMIRLLESNHSERFTALMDGYLPDWRARRNDLNAAPLRDEDWTGHAG
ncbi:YgjP-like metallopeptidase domain-containing protein [Paeniglutamicibacter kerguelensis]|uniref:YgjP-like metallopeptidase domain-containing protein n=1 Tax=Paeniglutamicibacter kerguelensis TaxID=254788 RepID=UPI001AE16C5D